MQAVQHGACLGIGLFALGTTDKEIYEDLKSVLCTEDAIACSTAGISRGLLLVGTGNEHAIEMLAYAHKIENEKIIRY
ncbi:hypothetical protein RchiOBHm_Chr6g0269111 [Rosa chinensis]|uniref:Uncharacterized protein n=1 Tax=Rosa chinensis TaxID=74649 RepID=A0A2P6PQC4_ROSCH|nr:hypothetical protein RchiOBHm_Chr6g0269111 [Rosa chinensis]